jgi:hypothetical protein
MCYNIFHIKQRIPILKSNKYNRFVDTSLKIVQSSRLSLFSCKYSKHIYTQHQLLVLVLLKEYISTDYRDFVELVDLMNEIKVKLGLDKIPHFTTLQKFGSRISSSLFSIILSRILKLFLFTWRECFHHSYRCNRIYKFLCKSLLF